MYFDSKFWAGTEDTLQSYLYAIKQFEAASASYGDRSSAETPDAPRLFSLAGNVGVISISGALVNNDSWMNEYRGTTGYPEIRAALIHAATHAEVKSIVLDINSGGGSVSGVSDTAELISSINKKMMPVHAFSDGIIASAAYWLGSSARTLSIGQVTEAGSIGVLTVHKEISKMLKAEGINATVLRAGEFKALGNQYEALSDTAKAEIQGQLDQMYEMFAGHVAEARGVTYQVADQKMGQGRVFIGSKAVDVGLVDRISSFDAVVAKAQGEIDSKKKAPQYGASSQKGTSMKVVLTPKQIAAAMESGNFEVVEQTDAEIAAEVAAAKVVSDAAAAAAATAPAEPAVTAPAEPAAKDAPADLVAYLKSSLAEANASVTDMTIKLRAADAASASLKASQGPLRAIAVASVDRMRVALDRAAGDANALDDTALLAEHAALRAEFESKFKAGGVAAVSAAAAADKPGEVADAVRQARIASTRPAK
jgi:signal peptide peptidase SppA